MWKVIFQVDVVLAAWKKKQKTDKEQEIELLYGI